MDLLSPHLTTPQLGLTMFLAQHWERVPNLPEEVEEANPQEDSAVPHKPATCYVGERGGEGGEGGGVSMF